MTGSSGSLPLLVAFDLDDTLAPSKSPVPSGIVAGLRGLLETADVAVISGGTIEQFQSQLVGPLGVLDPDARRSLHLLPTCGTQYYRDSGDGFRPVYRDLLSPRIRERVLAVIESSARELGLWERDPWGPILKDRGSQLTFSALGQSAPVAAKSAWDPDGSRRARLCAMLTERLPELEVRSGGSTSVDVTAGGIDKAYGMRRLSEQTGIPLERMLFVGDRLEPGGNDHPVLALGVRCIAVGSHRDTAVLLEGGLPALEAAAAAAVVSDR